MENCKFCLVYTGTRRNLQQHIRRNHADGVYICPKCRQLYTTTDYYKDHLRGCCSSFLKFVEEENTEEKEDNEREEENTEQREEENTEQREEEKEDNEREEEDNEREQNQSADTETKENSLREDIINKVDTFLKGQALKLEIRIKRVVSYEMY